MKRTSEHRNSTKQLEPDDTGLVVLADERDPPDLSVPVSTPTSILIMAYEGELTIISTATTIHMEKKTNPARYQGELNLRTRPPADVW